MRMINADEDLVPVNPYKEFPNAANTPRLWDSPTIQFPCHIVQLPFASLFIAYRDKQFTICDDNIQILMKGDYDAFNFEATPSSHSPTDLSLLLVQVYKPLVKAC